MKYDVFLMDGTMLEVPEAVGDAILRAEKPFIKWGNIMINLKSVSKIIPDNEPEFAKLPLPTKYTHADIISVLEKLHKGLKEFCETHPNSKAEQILFRASERLREEKSKKTNETAPDFLKISNLLN